jgi:hypothetical protein
MALKAKKLYQELRQAGWKPGRNVRLTQPFEELSEACGVEPNGQAIPAASAQMHLGHDADGFTIRDLFENLVVDSHGDPVGASYVNEMFNPQNQGVLSEAAAIGAVDSSAFMGITGQLMVTRVLAPYQNEEYILRKMIPDYPSPLKQERWIGIAPPKDPSEDMLKVAEGQEFTMVGFGEQYVETPITTKRGKIIGLTKEAIFFNLTGDITRQAEAVGDLLAFSEEKECLDCLIGTTTQFVEKRQSDSAPVTIDLYQRDSAGSGSGQLSYAYPNRPYPFVNDVPDNPLDDYTAIEMCDQYFSVIVDPNRGRPIVVGKPYVFAPHTKRINIAKVLQAENVFKLTQQGVNTVGALITNSPNPLGRIGMTVDQFAVSRLLAVELQSQLSLTADDAKDVWFYGDIARAFKYVVNWPVTVVQAPYNSEAEFSQDIVLRWKASKQGRVAIEEPRVMLRCNYLNESSGV